MTPDEFINKAMRTNAPTDKAIDRFNKLNHEELKKLLEEYISVCNKIDAVKKAVFYGKNYVEGSEGHDSELTQKMNSDNMNMFHGIIGMASESGELVEAFLKFMNGADLDLINIAEETGDSDWYKAVIHHTTKVSMEQVWTKIIAKLTKRYPEKFTEDCAINRDVKAERKILEG